ncbi:hypothetical protein [Amycolatopsis sp. NPDC051903]|uniref:hypothetical protein n=1 Tax=Amycolatopsis sp. NPDC051903 TaxID=3363936 RepID=UPI0037BBCF2D
MFIADQFEPWLDALDASSSRLGVAVAELSEEALLRSSFTPHRRIADVLAQLGAAGEISAKLLTYAAFGGDAAPDLEYRHLVHERWAAMKPIQRRDAWLEADSRHRTLLASLSETQRETVRVPQFNDVVTLPVYAGYLLSEQSVRAWDVEVSLNPAATIPRTEVDLLWQRIDRVVTWSYDLTTLSRLAPCQMSIELTGAERPMALVVDLELHIYPCEAYKPVGTISGSSEDVLRLIYGRNRAADGVRVTGRHALADLRALFPGA